MTHAQSSKSHLYTDLLEGFAAQLGSIKRHSRWTQLHRRLGRFVLLVTFFLLSALSTSAAHAAEDPIYTSFINNKAVGGYDVVSYFQGDMKPIKGDSAFQTEYKGADWYFASQKNLDLFLSNPEKYEPQYGGYCAYALAFGDTVKGDPLQYHINDGKLYLNINAKYKKIWLADMDAFIEKANKLWPGVL